MIVTGSVQSFGYTGVAETNTSQNFIKSVYLNKNKSRSRLYHASKKKKNNNLCLCDTFCCVEDRKLQVSVRRDQ